MLKNQTFWLAKRILDPKHNSQTVQKLEMAELIRCCCRFLYTYMDTHLQNINIVTQISLDILPDSILGTTFGMSRYTWPRPYEWNESNRWIYACLITCKKINLRLSSYVRYSLLVILDQFICTWSYQLEIIK